MTLLNAAGKPLVTEDMLLDRKKRIELIWGKLAVVLDEEKVTVDELSDLTVTMFNCWCAQCAAGLFEQQANMMMNFFLQVAQKHGPIKAGELKIRASLAQSNQGIGEKQ